MTILCAIFFEAPAAFAAYKDKKIFWHPWGPNPDASVATYLGVLGILERIMIGGVSDAVVF